MRGLTVRGQAVGCRRVPFAGLHLGDLLLHFQDIMRLMKMTLWLGGLLLRLVSKCEVVRYPRQLKVDPERGGHDVLR
jgi:hypothetical protein